MSIHPTTGFDLDEVDRLLTTTKQVRKRLDLTRPVPANDLLEIIEIANHAPMGGNLERNRWLIVTDAGLKTQIAERFAAVGRPYLAANSEIRGDDRSQKVIESAEFLVDHLAEVPALVIARAPRPTPARPIDAGRRSGVLRLGPAWRVELPARSTSSWHRLGMDDVPPRARSRDRRAPRHPAHRHAGVPPRRRLLHRRNVHTRPTPAGAGRHLRQPLEASRRVAVNRDHAARPSRVRFERQTADRSPFCVTE